KIEESLNVTFDATPPPSKTSPLADDDLDEEEAIKVTKKKKLENDIEDESLKIDEILAMIYGGEGWVRDGLRQRGSGTASNALSVWHTLVSLELAFDHYLSHDRVMHPLAPHYERKIRADQGMKRPRESKASSSSTTQNHPSSSRPLDHMVDENDDESFHSNSSSPSQQVSSSSNVASRVRQNPSHESHNLNTFLSETITLQTQQ
ncbi:hypothetical protein Tco_1345177, partial [Tanacetum coccineum]